MRSLGYLEGARWRPLLLCLLLLPALALAEPDCTPPASTQSVAVRYVIDGDTVILGDGRHVRLIGLNAPEIGHEGAPDQPFAQAARMALQRAVKSADMHLLLATGPESHDHYHRVLAHLYTPDGKDLSASLLRAGLASLIAIPPNTTRLACYADAESIARERHSGLWAEPSPLISAAGDIASDREGYAILRGTVSAVRHFKSGLRIELDDHVWLWITHTDIGRFVDPDALLDQTVLVRGWLHPYHGHPEMAVHDPAVITASH